MSGDPPRHLPPTPQERIRTVVSRMAGGSDAGSTRFARPIRTAASPQNGSTLGDVVVGDTTGQTNAIAIAATTGGTGDATADAVGATAVGAQAFVNANHGTAVGFDSRATGDSAVAVNGSATADNSIAIGGGSAGAVGGIAIGANAIAYMPNMTVIGTRSTGVSGTTGTYSTSIGYDAFADDDGSVAIGTDSGGVGAVAGLANLFVLGTANHHVTVPGDFGVHGATPVGQSPTPTTLADVIAILQSHGFCA